MWAERVGGFLCGALATAAGTALAYKVWRVKQGWW